MLTPPQVAVFTGKCVVRESVRHLRTVHFLVAAPGTPREDHATSDKRHYNTSRRERAVVPPCTSCSVACQSCSCCWRVTGGSVCTAATSGASSCMTGSSGAATPSSRSSSWSSAGAVARKARRTSRRAACRDRGPQPPAAGGERPHAACKIAFDLPIRGICACAASGIPS